jgi:acyl-CoA reductase-like NAD-dependent aldehyde dehydrogenase
MSSDSTVPIWIDNKPVQTSSTFPITQASTSTTVHHAHSASSDDAKLAADSSWTACKTWRNSTHTTRRDLILRVADYFAAHLDDLAKVQQLETSCTEPWARQNVNGSVAYLKEIAAQVSSVTGVIPPIEKPNTMGFVFKEPIGPILCIAPWNAALILAVRGIASAIAVGCTVVFKASELCPRTHFAITQAFVECGAPPGVLNQLQTSRDNAASITETLIAHSAIRKIEFIGSAAVGRKIGEVAARYLKPIIMELGGKCPALILDDANLREAAKQCALGAVMNHGQICFGTERIIVLNRVAESFQSLLVDEMKRLGEENVQGGAVSREIAQHAKDVLVESDGLCLLRGHTATQGAVLGPTLILGPSEQSRIFDEETFGPSASLYRVASDEEAIKLANKSSYGLNATVWTRNMARFMRIARELEYGQVHANSISVYTSPTGSQGGVKGSGFGRQNGKWGLDEFAVEKFVSWCG